MVLRPIVGSDYYLVCITMHYDAPPYQLKLVL